MLAAMLEQDYRIIIPAKGDSERAPEKNSLLLGWTLEYVRRLGLQDKTALLSQHDGYLHEAESLGITPVEERSKYPDQIAAVHQVIRDLGWEGKIIVMLQPTQPLRQRWLVQRCLDRMRKCPGAVVATCNLRQEKIFVLSEQVGGYRVSTRYQPKINGNVMVFGAGCLLRYDDHLSMWNDVSVCLVEHKYPNNMDFDYPEDMLAAPAITRSVFDLFYYSRT